MVLRTADLAPAVRARYHCVSSLLSWNMSQRQANWIIPHRTRALPARASPFSRRLVPLSSGELVRRVARTVLATLLAEASDTLQRRDYHALRLLCGSAPVTRRSGKSCVVVRPYACNHRLRNATYQRDGPAQAARHRRAAQMACRNAGFRL